MSAYNSIAESQAAMRAFGESIRIPQLQSIQGLDELGKSLSAFSDLGRALSESMVASQAQWQTVIDNISASVRPIIPEIASTQAALAQFATALQAPGLGLSVAAAQRAISTTIPANTFRDLAALYVPITQTAVALAPPVTVPGRDEDALPDKVRAREVEVEQKVAAVLPSLVMVAEQQPSGGLTISEAIRYSVVLYIAAGVTSAPLLIAFLSAIAAALVQVAIQSRLSGGGDTDRIVRAIEQLRADADQSEAPDDPKSLPPKA